MFRYRLFPESWWCVCIIAIMFLIYHTFFQLWDMVILLQAGDFSLSSWLWDGFWLMGLCATILWIERHLRQISIYRYDTLKRQLLLSEWHTIAWRDLKVFPENQFIGIIGQEIHPATASRYGRIILLHQDGISQTEIERVQPRQGDLNMQLSCEKFSEIMHLPILRLETIDEATEGKRIAQPERFQAAKPPITLDFVLFFRVCWAVLFVFLAGGLVYLTQTKLQDSHIALKIVLWVFAVYFVQYALWGLHGTWRMHRDNLRHREMTVQQEQGHHATAAPQIDIRSPHFARQSAQFVLFSRVKVVFRLLLSTVMAVLLLFVGNFSIGTWVFFGVCMVVIAAIYRHFSQKRQWAYDALSDTFTVYQLDQLWRWQPEKVQSANDFVGVCCEHHNEIWLIGTAGGEDILLGISNQAEKMVKCIAQCTGLPILQRMDR